MQHYLKHKRESDGGRGSHENIYTCAHIHTHTHAHTNVFVYYISYTIILPSLYFLKAGVYHSSFCNSCHLLAFQDEGCNRQAPSINAEGSRFERCSFMYLSPMKTIKECGRGDVPAKRSYFNSSSLTNTSAQGSIHSSQFLYLVAS